MAMSWIWAGMAVCAVIIGAINGNLGAVSAAAMEGAGKAIELCLTMAGAMCLWSGVMEVMRRCELDRALAKLFRPILRLILPRACADNETLAALSGNISANLLGLGNAATPLGIRAAQRMADGLNGAASDELCRLVVLNTASIQLLPTTVAALRVSYGCTAPFDILPCVWISSVCSVGAGLLAAWLLGKVWRP